jgi:hypothetical protein
VKPLLALMKILTIDLLDTFADLEDLGPPSG